MDLRFTRFIPYSYVWIVAHQLPKARTVLDVGCGEGEWMSIIKQNGWQVTGIDIHKQSLADAKRRNIYSSLINGDAIKVCEQLVKQKKHYDLVLCSQLVEHLTEEDGIRLLTVMEKLAKYAVFVSTPRGFVHQHEHFVEENPHQDHKSGWLETDFRTLGYRVYGIGSRLVWSEHGLGRSSDPIVTYLAHALSFVMSPLVFYVSSLASGLIAIKYLKHR